MKKNLNSSSNSLHNSVSAPQPGSIFMGSHPPLPIGGSLRLATNSEPKVTVLQLREQISSIMGILKREEDTNNPREVPITVTDNLGFLLHSRKAIEDEDGKKGKRRRDVLSIKETEDMLEKLSSTVDDMEVKEKKLILKEEGQDLDPTNISSSNSVKSLNSLTELDSIKSSRYHHLGTVATLSQIHSQREGEEEQTRGQKEHTHQTHVEKVQHKQLEKNRRYALSLATLSARGSEKRAKIVRDGCISVLIELLSIHPDDPLIQAYIASAFASLSSDSELWLKILENSHSVSTLLTLISSKSPLPCIRMDSLKALVNLSAYSPKENRDSRDYFPVPCEERFAKETVPTSVVSAVTSWPELRDLALQMLVNLSSVTEKYSRMEEMTESLRMVCDTNYFSSLTEAQEYKVLEAFVNLSALRANQIQLVEDLCLPIIEKFCYTGNDTHKKMACEVLKNLTSDSKSRSKLLETSSSSIFSIIVSMLSPENKNVDIKLESATCLFFLSIDKNFRRKIIQSEAFYHLLEQCKLTDQSLELYRIISKILRIFCEDEEFTAKLVEEGVGKALISLMTNSNGDYPTQQSCTECVCLLFQYHDIMKKLLLRGEKVYEVIVNLSYHTKEKLTQEWCAYALYQLTNSQLCTDSTIQRLLLPCILHLAWGGGNNTKALSNPDLRDDDTNKSAKVPVSNASPLTKAFCAGAIACCSTPSSKVDCSKTIPLLIKMLDEESLISDHPGKPKEDHGFFSYSTNNSTSTDWTSLVKYHCASALFNLSIEERNCHYMYNYDALTPVVKLTQISNTKVICAGIISRMSLYYKPYIHMYNLNVLRELLGLSNIDDRLTQRRVVIALSNLSQNDDLRSKLLSLKPNKNIVKLASLRDEYLRRGCISIVCNISYQQGSERQLIQSERNSEDSNLLKTLLITSVITSDQVTTRIICVKTILNLMYDREIYAKLVKEGVLWTLTKICSLELEREKKLLNSLKQKTRRISPSTSRHIEEDEEDYEGIDFNFLDEHNLEDPIGTSPSGSDDLAMLGLDEDLEDMNERNDSFNMYDKEHEAIRGELHLSNELIFLCSIAICRLSTQFSEHILQNFSELRIILTLLKRKDIVLKRPLARIITNLLMKTTDKDEKIRQLIVRHMSPILDTTDSELNELCVVCLCLASQSELCREEIVSSGMLQKIDPSAIFSRDGTISYAYITMFSNIANNNGQVRTDVLDDNLVERLEKILAQSTIRNQVTAAGEVQASSAAPSAPTSPAKSVSSPSKGGSLDEGSYANDFEEFSKSQVSTSSALDPLQILDEELNSCDCDDDPKLRLAVMKALYCVSCATVNVKNLVKQQILSFICRLLAIPDCTVPSQTPSTPHDPSQFSPSSSFVSPKLRKYKSYRNIHQSTGDSFLKPPPIKTSNFDINHGSVSSVKVDSKDSDLPKYTPEVIEQYEILFRFYLIACLYNLTTCQDSLNELVCSGIMKIFNYLWPQAQTDNRTARLIIIAITHLACGKTNSARLVEDGATRILSFVTSYKQILASHSYAPNHGKSKKGSYNTLNSNSSTHQALLTPVPVSFTQDDYLRVSAALRNLLISVSNQAKMVEEGCLVTLVQLTNQTFNHYDRHPQIISNNPHAFHQQISLIQKKVLTANAERRKSIEDSQTYSGSGRSTISTGSKGEKDKEKDDESDHSDDTSSSSSSDTDTDEDDDVENLPPLPARYTKSTPVTSTFKPLENKSSFVRSQSITGPVSNSPESRFIKRNCAAALRSLTFNPEIRHLLVESEAINIILNDISKEPDTMSTISKDLLKEIECESWSNGNRVSLKEAKVGYSIEGSVENFSANLAISTLRSRKESLASNQTDRIDGGSSLNSSSGVSSNAGIYSELLKGMSNVELNVDVKDIELIKYSVQIQLEDNTRSESPGGKSRNSSFSSESISFSIVDFTSTAGTSPTRASTYMHNPGEGSDNQKPLSPTSAAQALAKSFFNSGVNLSTRNSSSKIRKTESFEFNTDKLDSPSTKLRQSISLEIRDEDQNQNQSVNSQHLELIAISYLTPYAHDEASLNLRSRAYPKMVCMENQVSADPLTEINLKTVLKVESQDKSNASSSSSATSELVSKNQANKLQSFSQSQYSIGEHSSSSEAFGASLPSPVQPQSSLPRLGSASTLEREEDHFLSIGSSVLSTSLKEGVVFAPLTHLHHQYHRTNSASSMFSKSASAPILGKAGLQAISTKDNSPSSPSQQRRPGNMNQTLPLKGQSSFPVQGQTRPSSSQRDLRGKIRQTKSADKVINNVLVNIRKAREGQKSLESVLDEWKDATRY